MKDVSSKPKRSMPVVKLTEDLSQKPEVYANPEEIKIEVRDFDGVEINSVDARELHKFLESGRQFSNWIQDRIKQCEFIEGLDFITINNSIYSPPRKEYIVSIDAAKELCMMEKNEIGRRTRRYFIEMERIAKQKIVKPRTREEIFHDAFVESQKCIEEQQVVIEHQKQTIKTTGMQLLKTQHIVETQKPKVEFAETVMKSDRDVSLSQGMKILGIPRPNNMLAVLRTGIANGEVNHSFKWLQKRGGKNYPMQHPVSQGWLRSGLVTNSAGQTFEQTFITVDGIDKLRKLIKKFGLPEEAA